jgi:hypothetical protein
VGTLFEAFHYEFREFVRNFAVFYSLKISDGGEMIPIDFFIRVSHREVRDNNFLKLFSLD